MLTLNSLRLADRVMCVSAVVIIGSAPTAGVWFSLLASLCMVILLFDMGYLDRGL